MSILKELTVKHPYYCSESNYYSNDPAESYGTMTEFLDDFEGMDPDLNLCFRWDFRDSVDEDDKPTGNVSAEVFLMLQRKGIFKPCSVAVVTEEESIRFKAYAERHLEVIKKMWSPLWKESAQ